MPQIVMKTEVAIFGGGCFWCIEAVFQELPGVISVMPGYAGGHRENPTYEEVCRGKTGHAEVIKIEYYPEEIGYKDLLTVFFATHDPTTMNKQGNDVGTQYRSAIFYTSDAQKQEAEMFIKKLNESTSEVPRPPEGGRDPGPKGLGRKPIVTEVKPLEKFYEAEDYHREYYRKNPAQPYCQIVINPKLGKLQKDFAELL